MRLIRSATIRLEEFMDHEIPKYAILSHTWDADEVTFHDMKWLEANEKNILSQKGYDKIQHSCQRALQDGIEYVWVDTCCIDKTSSAELSEAINSMMKWYENAEICYAYLSDVPQQPFENSRWFTRGWTLQELLAPARLVFLAHDWCELSSREKVCDHLSDITGITVSFLEQRPDGVSLRTLLNSASIAERMNWAAKRQTSRQEDRAYSLLGIFGINMPLLYGEGMGAFLRLQEEIIKRSDDQSLLAWTEENVNLGPNSQSKIESEKGPNSGSEHQALSQPELSSFDTFKPSDSQEFLTCGILAESPAAFLHCGNYIPCSVGGQIPSFSITNKGLSMQVPLLSCKDHSFVLIPCQTKNDSTILLTIPVRCVRENIYIRVRAPIHSAGHHTWSEWPLKHIYLLPTSDTYTSYDGDIPDFTVKMRSLPSHLQITNIRSAYAQKLDQMILMKGNLPPDWNIHPPVVFVWLKDIRDNSELAFGCKVTLFSSVDTVYGSFQSDDFLIECHFVELQRSKHLSIREMEYWMEPFYIDTVKTTCAHSFKITVEDFFEKSLFSIEIIPGYFDNGWVERKVKEVTVSDLRGTVLGLLMPSIREERLRLRWVSYLTRVMRLTGRLIRGLIHRSSLLPSLFTFVVELPIQIVLTSLTLLIPSGAWRVACLSMGCLLVRPSSLKRFFLKYIPSFWRKFLGKSFFQIMMWYMFCKLLPERILS